MPLHSTMNARVHHEFVNTKFGRFIEICIERSTLSYTYAPQSICLSFHTYMKYYCVPSRPVPSRRDELFINNCENFMTAQS